MCTSCGLVLDEKCFDESQEWRTFAPEGVGTGSDAPGRQRADVSNAVDPLMDDFSGGTVIGGCGSLANGLQRAHQMVQRLKSARTDMPSSMAVASQHLQNGDVNMDAPAPAAPDEKLQQERLLRDFTERIRTITERLSLGENLVQRCVSYMQELSEKEPLKQRKQLPWLCALVHLASVQEEATQTIHQLAQANAGFKKRGATAGSNAAGAVKGVKRDVLSTEKCGETAAMERAIEKNVIELRRLLKLRGTAYVEDPHLMARMVTQLGLAKEVAKPASHILQQAYRTGAALGQAKLQKMPQSTLMATAIFVVAWLLDVQQKPSFLQVAAIARVTEAQVRSCYQLMHPCLRYLLPPKEDFACRLRNGLEALPKPDK